MIVSDWGIVPYGEALERQRALNLAVSRDEQPGTLVLVEHPDVITVSNRSRASGHVLASAYQLKKLGVTVHDTDRGGDVTFHGPGQLVAYPILRLHRHGLNLSRYMRLLEQVVIDTVAGYGIVGTREPGATGVWVEQWPVASGQWPVGEQERRDVTADALSSSTGHRALATGHSRAAKVCALGVRVRQHTTMHGLALNVSTDLSRFWLIDPCGLGHRPVASLRSLLGDGVPTMEGVKRDLVGVFQALLARCGSEVGNEA